EVEVRPHPRRIPHLQVEATGPREGRREVEFPVEELLFFRDGLCALEPWGRRQHAGDVLGTFGVEHALEVVQLFPLARRRAQSRLTCIRLYDVGTRHRAEEFLEGLKPFVER